MSRFSSVVGDDGAGREYLSALEARGLSTAGVTSIRGGLTPTVQTRVDAKGNASWKIQENAPWNDFSPTDAAEEWAAGAEAICFDRHFPATGGKGREAWVRYVDAVGAEGVRVFDVKTKQGVDEECIKNGFERATYFKCKEDEIKDLVKVLGMECDPKNQALFYITLTRMYTGLKGMGYTARRGMCWLDQLMKFESSGPPAHVVNSIGAGDAIVGAMVTAKLRGVKNPLGLYMGVAGVVCGAFDGMPTLPEELIKGFSATE